MGHASRRAFVLGAAALSASRLLPARAQAQAAKVGFLFTPARATSQVPGLFAAAMRDIAWVEGRNLAIEWRFAEGRRDRLPELSADLLQQRVQVIVAPTNIETDAARRATTSVPIVTLFAIDPVASGFASSLGRPGGNVTGVLYAEPEFTAKSVQLLREAVPTIRRLGYLYQAGMAGIASFVAEMESVSRKLGLAFFRYAMERPEQLPAVLEEMRKDGIDALRVTYVGAVQAATAQLLEFAASARIATLFTVPTPVDRGGLMSYSPRLAENAARAAALTDKLLKGAAVAQLPFEYPTRYELVVSSKAARQIGITLPQSILASADRVIE